GVETLLYIRLAKAYQDKGCDKDVEPNVKPALRLEDDVRKFIQQEVVPTFVRLHGVPIPRSPTEQIPIAYLPPPPPKRIELPVEAPIESDPIPLIGIAFFASEAGVAALEAAGSAIGKWLAEAVEATPPPVRPPVPTGVP